MQAKRVALLPTTPPSFLFRPTQRARALCVHLCTGRSRLDSRSRAQAWVAGSIPSGGRAGGSRSRILPPHGCFSLSPFLSEINKNIYFFRKEEGKEDYILNKQNDTLGQCLHTQPLQSQLQARDERRCYFPCNSWTQSLPWYHFPGQMVLSSKCLEVPLKSWRAARATPLWEHNLPRPPRGRETAVYLNVPFSLSRCFSGFKKYMSLLLSERGRERERETET
uniref:Uncharacterized protein n=1 Tax=Myotis myotis TaxID=51298 RepID=A0A7J7RRY0_MYOMY|nr:hypothetical protein mMyoMyo1_010229 [Myotis myotis]